MKSNRLLSLVFALILAISLVGPSQASSQQPVPDGQTPDAVTPVDLNPFSTGPSYDSGWKTIAAGESIGLWHGLGLPPALMLVHLQTRLKGFSSSSQRFIGGNDLGTNSAAYGSAEDRVGAYWHNLTTNYISVTRMPEDSQIDKVRVTIWEMSHEADFSSGWVTIAPNQQIPFAHGLGGASSDDYVVDVMFNDSNAGGLGVNQRAFGGRDFGALNFFSENSRVGGFWFGLDPTGIYIYRQNEDEYADQMLVRIWKSVRATYDSGWVAINPASYITFLHNIGGNPEDYRVDMQFKGPDWCQVNQVFYGGNDIGALPSHNHTFSENNRVGAWWTNLDSDSILVYRQAQDYCAAQVRIRIWNFWTPTTPEYDSGWQAISPGGSIILEPHFTGALNDRLIDLESKESGLFSYGVHQYGFGGADLQGGSRIGVYWEISFGKIIVYRREEDTQSPYVRVRFWKMPKPAYDSGYVDVSSAYSHQFNHYLGGNPADYLVNMTFNTLLGGLNQHGYGTYFATYLDGDVGKQFGMQLEGLNSSHLHTYHNYQEDFNQLVRIRIWTLSRPDYDSGMSGWGLLERNITHDLNVNRDQLMVNLMFNNPSGPKELHQIYYGGAVLCCESLPPNVPGDELGAFWRKLTSTGIEVAHFSTDPWAEQFRLRIWVTPVQLFLPMVRR